MPRGKATIVRDSVFRSSTPTTGTPAPTQGVKLQDAPRHQTAVWLGDDEVDWLDAKCREIRRSGWRSITRSALIRAMIRAAMTQPADLSGVDGEAELSQRLALGS